MKTYKDAGVDIDAGAESVKRIKKHARETFNKYVLTDLGRFGGLFELDTTRCQPFRLGHIRDMATQLERLALSANLAEVKYLLRALVAQTSLLSFKEYLSAKNLQVEVRGLRLQLLNFLNSPLSYRVPFLIRILVRNISGIVAKPKLIDRLWNDTIELAEVHLRGSQIVNAIRRSTHHALGKRTLLILMNSCRQP